MISRVSGVTPVSFHAKNRVNFGHSNPAVDRVEKDPDAFYELSDSNKLNVLFRLLVSTRGNQESAYEAITGNQCNIQNANRDAFIALASNQAKKEKIYDVFEQHRTVISPEMPVFPGAVNRMD